MATSRAPEDPHKQLSSDEIKQICLDNNLTRGQVYSIRSQFVSMVTLSDGYIKESGIK